MPISTVLQTVYASAPANVVIIPTLEIVMPGYTLRLAASNVPQVLGVNGVMQEFEACHMDVALPAKDSSGNQTLQFAVSAIDGRAERYVTEALEAGQPVTLTYREYLSTDKAAPSRNPITLNVVGGVFEGLTAQFECSYNDMLNTAWPRERYTIDKAPGLKYMQ